MIHKVFLIDDDRSVNFYNRWMLEQNVEVGQILEFGSAEEALSSLDNEAENAAMPELIFLDLNMPGKNGLEFAEALQARIQPGKSFPLIVLLLNSILLKEQEEKVLKSGIRFLRNKPLEESELKEILSHLPQR